jgi:RNA polymerase sigma-70 factor (ECF subfamily)
MHMESHNPGDGQTLSRLERGAPSSRTLENGDGEWIRSAVERHEAALTAYARNVLGGDAERARDIVQEAFLRLVAQDPGKVGPHVTEWLYTVCRNLAIDYRRRDRKTERLTDAEVDRAVSDDPDPGARSESDDALSHVLRCMQSLPHNQQECIRLKFQGGLSYKEISGVTGLTVTNVGFLIHTGLKTLRQRLASHGPNENAGARATRRPPMARKET